MPVPMLKTYAEKSGKTLAEAEACWEKAKKAADKKFAEKDDHYWAWVNVSTQMCLGINATSDKEKRKKVKKKD